MSSRGAFASTAWAWELRGVTPTEKLVLLALVSFIDGEDVCFPGQVRISEMTGLSDRSVRSLLASLTEKGLVDVQARYRKGHRTSNQYRVMVDSEPKVIPEAASGIGGSIPETPSAMDEFIPEVDDSSYRKLTTVHTGSSFRGFLKKNYPEELSSRTTQTPLTPQGEDHSPSAHDQPSTSVPALFDRSDLPSPTSEKHQPEAHVPATRGTPEERAFDLAWRDWPRKVARKTALRAFERAAKRSPWSAPGGMAALAIRVSRFGRAYRLAVESGAIGGMNFVPHLATWLNGERWDEELPGAPAAGAPSVDRMTADTFSLAAQYRAQEAADAQE